MPAHPNTKQLVAREHRKTGLKRKINRNSLLPARILLHIRFITAALFTVVAAIPFSAIAGTLTLPLQNQTGLNSSQYTIYVLGYTTASQKMLKQTSGTTDGTFVAIPNETGTLPAYKLGSDITQIKVDTGEPLSVIDGARVYLFVADNSVFPSAPVVTYQNYGADVDNVPNPPNSTVPPYTFFEFTLKDLSYGAVIDLQTVDGFTCPLNITLNSGLGSVGQPLSAPEGFNRDRILDAYLPFMNALGAGGVPYLAMQYSENSGGLLNPGIYLTEVKAGNFQHLDSMLNSVFDAALNTLFSNLNLSIQGVSKGSIAADVYAVSSTGEQNLPGGSSFKHPALQFKGTTNGRIFNVFNPVGLCVMYYTQNGNNVPISGQLVNTTLTFDNPLPSDTGILVGMFVTGAGVDPNTTTVTSITRAGDNTITGVVINSGTGTPAPSQYGFSKIAGMHFTSGAMVFANNGVFAYAGDHTGDEVTIILNLQNQIAAALNRGVANKGPTSGDPGYTSQYWGTQTNWYPQNETQNLFSLFMHTATVAAGSSTIPIFLQPSNAVACARGTKMGQAYGFAYDENAGPVPPAPVNQPNVPSKFDPVPSGTTTMTITLGLWGSGLPQCPECTRSPVRLKNVEFTSDRACKCSCDTYITLEGVTVRSGATLIFDAPTVTLGNGTVFENGSKVTIQTQ